MPFPAAKYMSAPFAASSLAAQQRSPQPQRDRYVFRRKFRHAMSVVMEDKRAKVTARRPGSQHAMSRPREEIQQIPSTRRARTALHYGALARQLLPLRRRARRHASMPGSRRADFARKRKQCEWRSIYGDRHAQKQARDRSAHTMPGRRCVRHDTRRQRSFTSHTDSEQTEGRQIYG